MIKGILFIILVSVAPGAIAASQKNLSRMEGYLFYYKRNLFISEQLGTTFPQYRVEWKKTAKNKKDLCVSGRLGECPTYTIAFNRSKSKNGVVLFREAEILSPFNDPFARRDYLVSLLAKSKRK